MHREADDPVMAGSKPTATAVLDGAEVSDNPWTWTLVLALPASRL